MTILAIKAEIMHRDLHARGIKTLDLADCEAILARIQDEFTRYVNTRPLSARLAYTWRSRYLQAAHAFGTNDDFGSGIDHNPASPTYLQTYSANFSLPTWGGSYGQLDMGVHYKVTDNLTVAVEGQNLTDALYKQYMQQGIGMKERSAFYTGRRYTLQMRYSF